MSISVWQQPPGKAKNFDCDVAVIGGGIVGAYTAHCLALKGKKVALLESRFPAAGATGRNAGMCLLGAADNYTTGIKKYGREKAASLWEATLQNQGIMRKLVEKFNVPHNLCGSYILAIDKKESDLLEEAYASMLEDNFRVDFLKEDPLGRGFGSALHQPEDFGLDPVTLVEALLEENSKQVTLFAPAEVFSIQDFKMGRLLVEGRGISVDCDQVALCTNAYSPLVSSYFQERVVPVRAQILLTTSLNRRLLDKLAYANYGYEYFRQLDNGTFLLGGRRDLHRDQEVGYDEVASAWLQASLEDFLQTHFPDVVSETKIARRWAGIMGFTFDGLPLVGRLPETPGLFPPIPRPFFPAAPLIPLPEKEIIPKGPEIYFAVGFNGHGLGWGAVSVEKMLEMM